MKIRPFLYLLSVITILTGCISEGSAVIPQQGDQPQEDIATGLIVEESASNKSNSNLSGPVSDNHQEAISILSGSDLSQSEIEGILFMREEEKLARDIYLALGEIWDMNIFNNIAKSEQSHMDAMLTLIEGFGLEDPVSNNGLGEFSDPDLQSLYNSLIAQGSNSLADALIVGNAIEEIDILDLQEHLSLTTNEALLEVYTNLLKGSINHLAAFSRTYQRQTGEEYSPQYIELDEYLNLMSTMDNSSMNQDWEMKGGGQGKGRRES